MIPSYNQLIAELDTQELVTWFMLGLEKSYHFHGDVERLENFLKSLEILKNGPKSPEHSGKIFPTILVEIFDAKF